MRYGNLLVSTTLLYLIIAGSCAKISSSGPTGGPQDETPPVVLNSEPENGSVNFSGKVFEITFDEYFILADVNQKMLVSPPLEERPEIKVRGKKMEVTFEEELRENVTYNFYFQDAIQDLNENNPLQNFQYVFSTGPVLDSLSITGYIYDATNLDPGNEVFI